VEAGFPDGDEGDTRRDLLEEAHGEDIRGIVRRRGWRHAFHLGQHLWGHDDRLAIDAAMHGLETNGVERGKIV
jgi:hypothetical protein